ncbi:MAG: GNAT family N-acetyltransferase [Opitutaceae bacterium]
MSLSQLQLRTLRVEDEVSFRNAVAEFARDTPPWLFVFDFSESTVFTEFLGHLERSSRGIDVPAHFVPYTYLAGVVDGEVVGRLMLRHTLNANLAKIGGHIGYGVIPSQRRRGYATAMLRQALPLCAARGIRRALITCDEHNTGSRKTIEACGGIFEGFIDDPESNNRKRRYWVETDANHVSPTKFYQ